MTTQDFTPLVASPPAHAPEAEPAPRPTIKWGRVGAGCPVCHKHFSGRRGTIRHLRLKHFMVPPGSPPPISSEALRRHMDVLRARKAAKKAKGKRTRKWFPPPTLPPLDTPELREDILLSMRPTARPAGRGTVRYCPSCGFELARINVTAER